MTDKPEENPVSPYDTRECIVRSCVSLSHASVDYVNVALSSFRGSEKYSFEQALQCAEKAYLETYAAWNAEKNDKATYREIHERAKALRDKMLEIKKLMDELECEGDRLLQSLHSLRT